jgi:hypothetical protein
LGVALTLSVCSLGCQGPDRQIPDEVVLTAPPVFEQDFAIVSTDLIFVEARAFQISGQEAELDRSDQELIPAAGLNHPISLFKAPTDLVVESDKHRDWGQYILPIWDYEPIIEPPISHSRS